MALDAVVVFGLFLKFIYIYEHTVYVMSWLAKNYDIDSMEIVNYNVKIICLRCYTLQSTETGYLDIWTGPLKTDGRRFEIERIFNRDGLVFKFEILVS